MFDESDIGMDILNNSKIKETTIPCIKACAVKITKIN